MPKETFSATAKVHIVIEVDLKQAWGDEEIGYITERSRKEAHSYINNLAQKEGKLRVVSIGDCFISLHSRT